MNLKRIGLTAGMSYVMLNHLLHPNHQSIYAMLSQWIDAIKNGSPKDIAELYSQDAILLGTFAKDLTLGRPAILNYFVELKKKQSLSARIISFEPQTGTNVGIASGLYEFSWTGGKVVARYSFVFQKSSFKPYLIINHHSSVVPQ
tara:strand:- start:1325 stop:1759 length:435 start_codon:yes stop_codon:yes gene_type:complete